MRIVIYNLLKILKKFKKKLQGNFKTPPKLATMKSVLPALFTLTIQVYAHVGQLFSGIYISLFALYSDWNKKKTLWVIPQSVYSEFSLLEI